jgi:hypothetical protein
VMLNRLLMMNAFFYVSPLVLSLHQDYSLLSSYLSVRHMMLLKALQQMQNSMTSYLLCVLALQVRPQRQIVVSPLSYSLSLSFLRTCQL